MFYADSLETVIENIMNLQKIDHPCVVKLHDLKEDEEKIYLVLDYMGGGSLRTCLNAERKLSEEDACMIVLTLADTLDYCHSLGIVHRDLKVIKAKSSPRMSCSKVIRWSRRNRR